MSQDYFKENGESNNVLTVVPDGKPAINVVSKKDFLDRAYYIFQAYGDILKKTLGAYGSPTIISNYPYKDVTKDGYSVARNLEFDMENSSELDKIVGGLIMDICSRLNYAVGDGTTTAIVATNKIFSEIYEGEEFKDVLDSYKVRPKDFMDAFNSVKDEIIENLEGLSNPITEDNLVDIIKKIVTISSNGDDKLINAITTAYEKIGFPAIICEKSETNDTYCEITDGYRAKVMLCDKIYINTDNQTADYKNADVIIFDRKITSEIYNKIIKPINNVSRACGRKLICLAPYYDEVTLSGEIRREVQMEFNKTGTVNLVLCTYFNSNKVAKQKIADLATVLGTVVIDRPLEEFLLKKAEELEGGFIDVINCFDRGIDGILISKEISSGNLVKCENGFVNESRRDNTIFTLGFVDTVSIGLKQGIFKSTHYDEKLYNAVLTDAKILLDQSIEKFKDLGTYTKEVYDNQERYCSLKMKLATLYVGGESELSANMNRDAADDAIRAAESAYQFGYVKGCNLSIMTIINTLLETETDKMKIAILKAIGRGFMNVCTEVMRNAFPQEDEISISEILESPYSVADAIIKQGVNISNVELVKSLSKIGSGKIKFMDYTFDTKLTIAEILAAISVCENRVFDLTIMNFSDDVINSVKTDIEVLSASSELLSILMVGNQVVLSAWNHKRYN